MKNEKKNNLLPVTQHKHKKKIKLVFDARMLAHSGIGTYSTNYLNELIKLYYLNKKIELRLLGDSKLIQMKLPSYKGMITEFNAPIYSLREQITYPEIKNDELLHVPHYNAPLKYLSRCIVTIHDLIHLNSKEFMLPHYRIYASFMFKNISNHAKLLVLPSKATLHDWIKRYPNTSDKTLVLKWGFDRRQFVVHKEREKEHFIQRMNLPRNYLLNVGIGKTHKNIDFVIRALAPEWKSGRLSNTLVIAGCGPNLPQYILKEANYHGVLSYIKHIGKLDKNELELLYQSATLFLFPSKIEGLGFPVLEALALGTPVLCSQTSSLPEAGGKAAYYYEPNNLQDFRLKFYEILRNDILRKKCLSHVPKHLEQFNWTKHVNTMVKRYQEIID